MTRLFEWAGSAFDEVSDADVARGSAKARSLARQRRMVYRILKLVKR
jgi:hypothetical protein